MSLTTRRLVDLVAAVAAAAAIGIGIGRQSYTLAIIGGVSLLVLGVLTLRRRRVRERSEADLDSVARNVLVGLVVIGLAGIGVGVATLIGIGTKAFGAAAAFFVGAAIALGFAGYWSWQRRHGRLPYQQKDKT